MARRKPATDQAPADLAPTDQAPADLAPTDQAPADQAATTRPCPICAKPPVAAYTPFCSKRCADVDLHRWLGGVYAVPTEEPPDDMEMPRQDRDER